MNILLYEEKGMANKGKTPPGGPLRTGTILVIDDEPAVRDISSTFLTTSGYSVIQAADPRHALSLCSDFNARLDLVIADIVMPGCDGFTLIEEMRKIRGDFPVIYISGHVDIQEYRRELAGLTEGTDFLRKPFRLSDLLAMVDTLLGRQA